MRNNNKNNVINNKDWDCRNPLNQVTLHSSGVVTGGRVTTYLLEKTRVARQLEGERSYHVFYQLCAGADEEMRTRLGLKEASEFRSLVRFFFFFV